MKPYLVTTLLSLNLLAATPLETVQKIEGSLSPKNAKASYAFTNYRSDGVVMEYEVKFEMKDPNHSHAYFMKPEREKGREMLRNDDELWTFMPSVGKAVRIADKDSFAGGDFSNADVLRVDWTSKYEVSLLKELTNQNIYELKAKANDAPYAKMRLWVDKASGQPVQQQYYDSKGTLLKRCSYADVKKFGAVERPSFLRMENVITNQRSELRVLDLKTPVDVKESRFKIDNLGK